VAKAQAVEVAKRGLFRRVVEAQAHPVEEAGHSDTIRTPAKRQREAVVRVGIAPAVRAESYRARLMGSRSNACAAGTRPGATRSGRSPAPAGWTPSQHPTGACPASPARRGGRRPPRAG